MLLEKKKEHNVQIPTCSLADIVFLVLCFFLVSTTFDVDKGLGLQLPPKGKTIEVRKKNITNVLINAQGEVLVDNEVTQTPMIKDIIVNKLAKNDKLIVSVKTDRKTKYDTYIRVLDQLKLAFAQVDLPAKISFAEPEAG